MLEGVSIQVDIVGPYKMYTRAKQANDRELKRPNRAQVKMWLLLAVDYFASLVELSVLEDMTTKSVTAALQEIIAVQGWKTKKLSLNSGSSLVPAVTNTNEEL